MRKRLLFVCTGNVDRSPTAEHLFDGVEGVEAKSAGTSIAATVPLTKQLMEWADVVFVMEYKHQKAALKIAPDCQKKIEILEVPDIYYRDQPELKKLLLKRLIPYFNKNYNLDNQPDEYMRFFRDLFKGQLPNNY